MTEAIEVTGRDGTVLRGELRPAGREVVVLAHERGGDLDGWQSLASALTAADLGVLAYDLRGHGGSEGEPDPAWDEMDLEVVAGFVLERGAGLLFLGAVGTLVPAALAVAERARAAALFALAPLGDPASFSPAPSLPKLVLVPSGSEFESEALGVLAGRTLVVSLPVQSPILDSDWSGVACDHVVRFLNDARLSAAGVGA
jgi:alpha-beta hydrolase superfamily lysophospholipase